MRSRRSAASSSSASPGASEGAIEPRTSAVSAAARRERQEGAPLDRLVGAEFILRPTSQGEKHIFSSISLAHAPPARAVTIFGSSPTGAVDNEICGWGCYVYRSGSGDPGHVSGWAVDSDSPQSAIFVRVAVTWYKQVCFDW